jgi:hypothetical protein
VDEIRRAEQRLRPAMQAVMETARRGESGPQAMTTLEDLVRTWHTL